jgi:hypothetical protein
MYDRVDVGGRFMVIDPEVILRTYELTTTKYFTGVH